MKKVLLSAILLGACSHLLAAPGNQARGKALAAEGYCYTCHGDNGVAPSRNAPSLAGQSPAYVVKMLQAYKNGLYLDNKSLGMQAVAEPMSSQDMADLAAFYAFQPLPPKVPAGAPPPSAMACMACHSPSGAPGMGGAAPGLGGMSAGYIKRQLHAYQQGKRSDPMMGGLMASLTEAQIDEIANFYGSR